MPPKWKFVKNNAPRKNNTIKRRNKFDRVAGANAIAIAAHGKQQFCWCAAIKLLIRWLFVVCSVCACCRLDEWGFHFEVNCTEASDKTNAININRIAFGRCWKPVTQHCVSFVTLIGEWSGMQKSLQDKCDQVEELFVARFSNGRWQKHFAQDWTLLLSMIFAHFPVFDICYHVLFTLLNSPSWMYIVQLEHSYSPTFAPVELTIHTVCVCRCSSFVFLFCFVVKFVFLSDEWSEIARVWTFLPWHCLIYHSLLSFSILFI